MAEYQLENNNWIDDRYGSRQYHMFYFSKNEEEVRKQYRSEIRLLTTVLGRISEKSDKDEPDIWFRATEKMGAAGYCYWVAVDVLERFRSSLQQRAKEKEILRPMRLSKKEKELYQDICKGISNPFSFMNSDAQNRGIRRTIKSLVQKGLIYSEVNSHGDLCYYPHTENRITQAEKEIFVLLIESVQGYKAEKINRDEFLSFIESIPQESIDVVLGKLERLDLMQTKLTKDESKNRMKLNS